MLKFAILAVLGTASTSIFAASVCDYAVKYVKEGQVNYSETIESALAASPSEIYLGSWFRTPTVTFSGAADLQFATTCGVPLESVTINDSNNISVIGFTFDTKAGTSIRIQGAGNGESNVLIGKNIFLGNNISSMAIQVEKDAAKIQIVGNIISGYTDSSILIKKSSMATIHDNLIKNNHSHAIQLFKDTRSSV